MYGTETAAASTAAGSTLAVTGIGVGSAVLAAMGLIFLGVALIALFRPHKGRP